MQTASVQKAYVVYYRYKPPTEKSAPVRQFRLYANSLEEAKRMAKSYANYPNIEVISVKPA